MLDRGFIDAVVKTRPAKPMAEYWCPFCGIAVHPGSDPHRFYDGFPLDHHLKGECGKAIERLAELKVQASMKAP